jgi:mono/diheme cytochrome c family protein
MQRILPTLLFALFATAGHADDNSADTIQRGEYLARAAGCASCHTAPGSRLFAGGREFVLPIGRLYSTNITPDEKTGVGGYDDNSWVRMLQQGVSLDGRRLYPVMPYTSYEKMSRNDALAIKAYFFSLKPVTATPPENKVEFPYNQRWALGLWNLFNASNAGFQPDAAKSPARNRGAYLVEALGHCGECHTPRNFLQGLKSGKSYAGAMQQGWLAYNISGDRSAGIGDWSDEQLKEYLSTGQAPDHGPASGPMAEIVENSLRYLNTHDIDAIVAYLRDIPPQSDGPPSAPPVAAASSAGTAFANPSGEHLFAQACAGCHLPSGQGRQSPWSALGGSHTTGDVEGGNLVQILAHGSQIETSQGLMFMHSFTGGYTDTELAAIANYLIAQSSGRIGKVTPRQIRAQRGPDDHKLTDPPLQN